MREHPLTDRAAAETAGVVRVWPDGGIVSAEYSASHGPRSAGGPFPAVDDTASNVPQNPSYQWTRTLDVAAVAARYGLGSPDGGVDRAHAGLAVRRRLGEPGPAAGHGG